MATVADTLITEYRLKNQQFLAASQQVNQATAKTAQSINFAQRAVAGMNNARNSAAKYATAVVAAAVGVGAVAAQGFQFGKSAFEQYAAFDSLEKSLEAVEGNAERAKRAIASLKQIAKQPGIGFEESVRAYVGLRNANVGGGLAQSLISNIGNANARGGGGIDRFERAMLAIQQISMKQFLQGEELLQLMEAGIPVQGMIQSRFGTTDTEELKKKGITSAMVLLALNEELGKLPKTSGGAQNSLDNLSDSIKFMMVNLGSGLAGAQGPLDLFSNSISKLTDANIWASAMNNFVTTLGLIPGSVEQSTDALLMGASTFVGFGVFLRNFFDGFKKLFNLTPLGFAIEKMLGGKNGSAGFLTDVLNEVYGISAARDFYDEGKRKLADLAKQPLAGPSSTDFSVDLPKTDEPLKQISINTAKMAELQQKQLDLQQSLLGGGQVAQQALSGVRIGEATGDMSAAERKILEGMRELAEAKAAGMAQLLVKRQFSYR